MLNLKLTTVSAAVAAVLASTAVDAVPTNYTKLSNSSSVSKASSFNATSHDADFQRELAARPTVSGIASQFDSEMGKATFVWAPKNLSAPSLSALEPEARAEFAADYYLSALTGVNRTKSTVNSANLVYMHDLGKGSRIAKYRQNILGVEVFNREYSVMLNAEYSLVAGSGYFSQNLLPEGQIAPNMDFGNSNTAVSLAFKDLNAGDINLSLDTDSANEKYETFVATSFSNDLVVDSKPRAKKVYFDSDNGLIPAYYVEVSVADANSVESEYFGYVVDANSGKVLLKNNLVAHSTEFTYRAYAKEDGYPLQGPHGDVIPQLTEGNDPTEILDASLVTLSHYESLSTEDPWLEEGATITSGNNAFAYADVIPPQGFNNGDFTAETTSQNTFDYVLSDDERANSYNNRKAAIVNLFYMTNFLHDYYYDYGFDEASGNAQLSNYDRGGFEGDPLELQAQDYSGLNNANMATPADGSSPRMQQYLWNDKDATVGEDWGTVVTNVDGLGLLESSQIASFGPQQYSDVSGSVVRLVDGDLTAGSETDGCEPAINSDALAGNIAIIDRGGCAFTEKVINAQEAGAIGALIVNNVDDGTPAPMGGTDPLVSIPSMGLNFEEGSQVYAEVDANIDLQVEMFSNFPLKDSTFDNAIIAHEFGHYVQNRLVGNASGLINFQGRAMGEGWSDVHALLFVTKEEDLAIPGNDMLQANYGVGTFVADFFRGIRRAPYSTNMEINPFTFQHISTGAAPDGFPATTNDSPHGAGEIWAVTLWEMYVALVNEHGFDEGRDRMSRYIVEGYKMTPVAPTYTEARDAILASVYANNPEDFELSIAAFAKRGMGLGAISPDRFDADLMNVVESNAVELASFTAASFTLDANFDGETVGYCSADGILDNGETATLSVTVNNSGSESLTGVTGQIVVVSEHDIVIENDGVIVFGDMTPFSSSTVDGIEVSLEGAGTADEIELEIRFPEQVEGDDIVEPEPISLTASVNFDFDKKAPVGGSSTSDMEAVSLFEDFVENVMDGDGLAVGTRVVDTVNTNFFQSTNPSVNLGAQTMLIRNNDFISDVAYETDTVEIGFNGNFTISFWHAYLIESGYDGGVVEISLNGGEWQDATNFGQFTNGGYNQVLGEIADQPLSGRAVFSGRNLAADFSTAGNTESIVFDEVLNGNVVKFRFRMASDSAVSDFGWFIDNVTFSNIEGPVFNEVVAGDTADCDNSLPRIVVPETIEVTEGETGTIEAVASDRNGDTLSYSWVQTAGQDVELTNADTATLTFSTPSISIDATLEFEVTVSDGKGSVTAQTTVNVSNVSPPQPQPSSGGSSGGSMGWIALLLAPAVYLRRRMKRS